MANEARRKDNRSTRVLPCEFHQVLHGRVLVGSVVFGSIRGAEPVLFQHGRDGYGSGEVASRWVHASNREVDGGAEGGKDLRARVPAAVFAGVCRRRGRYRAQVEPAWAGG